MFNPRFVFLRLVEHVEQRRPWAAAALRAHEYDLMIVANVQAADEDRIAALSRAGAATIAWALAEPWPTGSSIPDQRLRADLQLLCAAWALANDPAYPDWYRELARATAHGIGLVIASGLSGEESPGGLDLHIWRACGTRSYAAVCDDVLCRLCWEHDRAREAIRMQASRQNWETFLAVAGTLLLTFGLGAAISSAFGRPQSP